MPSTPVKVRFLQNWVLIEFSILFSMIKYSRFTNSIGSGKFTHTFHQNTDKFQKFGEGGYTLALCMPLSIDAVLSIALPHIQLVYGKIKLLSAFSVYTKDLQNKKITSLQKCQCFGGMTIYKKKQAQATQKC